MSLFPNNDDLTRFFNIQNTRRILSAGLTVYFMIAIAAIGGLGAFWSRYIHVPEQPIDFSHKIHVHDQKLACETCHKLTTVSTTAGIPSVETCMTCHENLKVESPEVQKIHAAWKNEKPIVWERVHNLPDHVFFSHERHVNNGIDCASCHGQLAAMPKVKQVRSLEMGFCVDCHRVNSAPTECIACHM